MAKVLYVGTEHGLVRMARRGRLWVEAGRALAGASVTSLIASSTAILAGTTDGLFRSTDNGQSWKKCRRGLTIGHIRSLARPARDPGRALAGTEPAAIFVTHDNGESWRECPEVAELRVKCGWFLPYSPEAGCVRGFALHGLRAYAAVEQGGVLRSDDAGERWALAEGSTGCPADRPSGVFVHPDAHSVEVHPLSPDLLLAATGGGLYHSTNGGGRWTRLHEGYCRAVWTDPRNTDRLLLGPADGVDANGRIEQSADGGRTWTPATAGLNLPWPNHMVERFTPVGRTLLALLSNGDVFAATPERLHWTPVLSGIREINALAPSA